MNLLLLVLAVLGAIGGVLYLTGLGKRLWRSLRERLEIRRAPKDWYYSRLDIGARITDCGRKWEVTRQASIVCLRHGVDGLDLGVRPLNGLKARYRISPSDLSLSASPHDGLVGYSRFLVKPPQPLREGETRAFTFQCDFEKDAAPSNGDFLTWCSNRRVDVLILRVVLPGMDGVNRVSWRVLDSGGCVRREVSLIPDPVSGECRFEELSLVPHLTYSIGWKYPQAAPHV